MARWPQSVAPKHVALLMTGAARAHGTLGVAPSRPVLSLLLAHATPLLPRFAPLDVCQCLAALGALRAQPPAALMHGALGALRRHMGQAAGDVSGGATGSSTPLPLSLVAQALWACSALKFRPGWQFMLQLYSQPLHLHAFPVAGGSARTAAATPRSLAALLSASQLLAALARLQQRPLGAWAQALEAQLPAALELCVAALQRRGGEPGQGERDVRLAGAVATLLWALHRLHRAPSGPLALSLARAAAAAAPHLAARSPGRAQLALWSLARLVRCSRRDAEPLGEPHQQQQQQQRMEEAAANVSSVFGGTRRRAAPRQVRRRQARGANGSTAGPSEAAAAPEGVSLDAPRGQAAPRRAALEPHALAPLASRMPWRWRWVLHRRRRGPLQLRRRPDPSLPSDPRQQQQQQLGATARDRGGAEEGQEQEEEQLARTLGHLQQVLAHVLRSPHLEMQQQDGRSLALALSGVAQAVSMLAPPLALAEQQQEQQQQCGATDPEWRALLGPWLEGWLQAHTRWCLEQQQRQPGRGGPLPGAAAAAVLSSLGALAPYAHTHQPGQQQLGPLVASWLEAAVCPEAAPLHAVAPAQLPALVALAGLLPGRRAEELVVPPVRACLARMRQRLDDNSTLHASRGTGAPEAPAPTPVAVLKAAEAVLCLLEGLRRSGGGGGNGERAALEAEHVPWLVEWLRRHGAGADSAPVGAWRAGGLSRTHRLRAAQVLQALSALVAVEVAV